MDLIELGAQLELVGLCGLCQILHRKVGLIYILNQLVIELLDFLDKVLTVLAVSVFKLNQLFLHLLGVLLHILK